ncbi:MAG: hypothetical protein ISS57_07425 [Anaerolineales bacterium]|nr:hypothetical protein [Anaerolineales bacterium]
MKRISWIALLILSVSLTLVACGSASDAGQAPSAAEEAAPPEPIETIEVVELPADTPGGIYQAAMAGVETDVKQFLDVIPVPDKGSISMEDATRMDFITSLTQEECIQFYRETFPALGLIEIEELTKITDYGATLIFGGYPNGKAIRVKVSNLSQISRNILIHILTPADL